MVIKVGVYKNDFLKNHDQVLAYTGYFTFLALRRERSAAHLPYTSGDGRREKSLQGR